MLEVRFLLFLKKSVKKKCKKKNVRKSQKLIFFLEIVRKNNQRKKYF